MPVSKPTILVQSSLTFHASYIPGCPNALVLCLSLSLFVSLSVCTCTLPVCRLSVMSLLLLFVLIFSNKEIKELQRIISFLLQVNSVTYLLLCLPLLHWYILHTHFWFAGSLSAQTPREPAKRTSLQEYSINALRNSHFWTLSQSSGSFTGLDKNRIIGAPYASTSNYLRQQMLSEIEKQIILEGNCDRMDWYCWRDCYWTVGLICHCYHCWCCFIIVW